MKRFAFVLSDGTPLYAASPSVDDLYVDAQQYGEAVCRELPPDAPEDMEVLQSWYWKEGWRTRAQRPSEFHRWDAESEQWVLDLVAAKVAHRAQINAQRDAVEFGGFAWDGSTFDSDERSRGRIQGAVLLAVLAAQAGQPFGTTWTLADDTTRTLSGADMIAVGLTLGAHVSAAFAKSVTLHEAIEAAQTVAEVDAITWL